MYRVIFRYTDGSTQDCKGVTTIKYTSPVGYNTLTGQKILGHSFPLKYDFYLFGKTRIYSVSANNLYAIEITEEGNTEETTEETAV